eukprot:5152320-Amphidinium_carterae.1
MRYSYVRCVSNLRGHAHGVQLGQKRDASSISVALEGQALARQIDIETRSLQTQHINNEFLWFVLDRRASAGQRIVKRKLSSL